MENEITDAPAIGGWSTALEDLHGCTAHRFARVEIR